MEKETWEKKPPPTPPQATDNLGVRETRHSAAVPKFAAPEGTGGGGRGSMDGPWGHTWGEQTTARMGTLWSDGQMRYAEVGASGMNRLLNPSAGTCPNFSNSCRRSLNPCFVPHISVFRGPIMLPEFNGIHGISTMLSDGAVQRLRLLIKIKWVVLVLHVNCCI